MYCTRCFAHVFKDDPRTVNIRQKSKEIKWVSALLQSSALGGHKWRWDKPFYVDFLGGCCPTKRRIDLWTVVDGTIFAIEIDENQHKYRAKDYEETRYNDLFMDFSGRYVFLRVNPDAYKDGGRKMDPHFDTRLKLVEREISRLLESIKEVGASTHLVQVHHMFYDC